jgi:uncharacterized protein (UPF0210 family)
MKIRAITAFTTLHADDYEAPLARAGAFLSAAEEAFAGAGIVVQSRRVAAQPFPRWGAQAGEMPALAARVRAFGVGQGVTYLSLGTVGAVDDPAFVDTLPDVLAAAEGAFASIAIADQAAGIDLGLLHRAARVIRRTSTITPDGLTNLYLCASANVAPGTPFFPAAYHDGGPDRFALAIEAADLAVTTFEGAAGDPSAARDRLTAAIQRAADALTPIAVRLAARFGFRFGGLDFSLAPYPGAATSLGGAMEGLGVTAGGGGMVAAAALVMNAIEAADFPRCGFSGLMLPVLEDSVLGARAAEGALTLNDLLLYSAMCGTGLDCIPLPGDSGEAGLAGILLDVGALALRLDKPLTARLMPLPGKAEGDPVDFPDFEYFAPSRVMALPRPPRGLTTGTVRITPRP